MEVFLWWFLVTFVVFTCFDYWAVRVYQMDQLWTRVGWLEDRTYPPPRVEPTLRDITPAPPIVLTNELIRKDQTNEEDEIAIERWCSAL